MIDYISISNFATIENTEVYFQDGLNIITGETGAGKSIVIEAISLALGARADTSMIRTGTEKAMVLLSGMLNGEEIVISRELSSTGKNLCKLNGELTTLSKLNEVCSRLADIHGQYDNQSLLNPDNHIALLDSYHKDAVEPLKNEVYKLFEDYSHSRSELISLLNLEKDNARKKDFYDFQLKEIDKANLTAGEDEELEERILLLRNSEKIFERIASSDSILRQGSPSVLDGLSQVARNIEALSDYGKDFSLISEDLNDMYYRLQDIASSLQDKRDSMVFSPDELDRAITRLDTIDNLKKKYCDSASSGSVEEILQYADSIRSELNLIENFDDEKKRLEIETASALKQLLSKCEALSSLRKSIAEDMEKAIIKELSELNFADAQVKTDISRLEHPTADGFDKVEILISTNKGEALKPLYKVASGGEMSRIMLAFKNIISSYDGIPTLIFDEIDNGISGITASIVAKKLLEISRCHQVISITHLPQIAAKGEHNYRISKSSDDSKTYTKIEKLSHDEKVNEIARLLGGSNITETTLKSAEELIKSAP